jgi:hypothetical protein
MNAKCAHPIKQSQNEPKRNEPIQQIYLQSEPMLTFTNTTQIKQTPNEPIRNEPIEHIYLQSEPMSKITNTTRAQGKSYGYKVRPSTNTYTKQSANKHIHKTKNAPQTKQKHNEPIQDDPIE